MMQETPIVEQIKKLKPELFTLFGIKELVIFGSFARGEANIHSDIDIAILEMERKNGFLVAKAKRFLMDKLNREVDIGLYSALNPFIKKSIEKDLLHV